MGTLTLLELCNSAREELGWSRPDSYATSTDDDGLQTYRLANRQGRDLADQVHPWEELRTEGTITLGAATQGYELPADFRYIVPSSMWDSDAERITVGPLTGSEWARAQNNGTVGGLNWRWQIRGGFITFDQTVSATGSISYEYISSYWATNSAGTAKFRFTLDTDTQRFDDDLFVEGLIWRLRKAKGFEWETHAALYQAQLNRIMARDGGMRDVHFGHSENVLAVNVPDGNFG